MYYYDDRQHPIYTAYHAFLEGDTEKVTELQKGMQHMLSVWLKHADSGKSAYQISQATGLSSVLCSELKRIRIRHKRQNRSCAKYFAEDFLRVLPHEEYISVSEISRRMNCSPSIVSSHLQRLEEKQKVQKEIKYTRSGKATTWKAL